MADSISLSVELMLTFREIDGLIHRLEMYAMGEQFMESFTLQTDGSEIRELLQKAIQLIIQKVNYSFSNIKKVNDLGFRIDEIFEIYENHRMAKDDLQQRANFATLSDNLSEIVNELVYPFYDRHSRIKGKQSNKYTLELFDGNNEDSENEENGDFTKEKEGLTTKQQILLLHLLGVFELNAFNDMTVQKMGILFGKLLKRNSKNTEDAIRDRYGKLSDKQQKPVIELLKELGLEKLTKM